MIRPFGERGLLVEVDDAAAAQRLDASLRSRPIRGVADTIPGRASVLVELDPDAVADVEAVGAELRGRVAEEGPSDVTGRRRTIPVVYGGEHGPDLEAVAEATGMTVAEVVDMHAGAPLRVLFLGFAPGYPYIGDLPEPIHVPRLATPRTRTPAGSVAIAGPMTGIYPAVLPGGWRIIGRTPATLFDPRRDPPAYLAPGDVVAFRPIEPDAWDEHAGPPEDW